MIKLKAVKKWYDKYGKRVIGYTLSDESGKLKEVSNNDIKAAIKSGKIEVINLTITADNRLIKKGEEDTDNGINKANAIKEDKPIKKEVEKEVKKEADVDNNTNKSLSMLIMDNGHPSIAIWSETNKYNKKFYSLSKNESEIKGMINGVGFKNFKIINGKQKISETDKPIILNRKELSDTEIFQYIGNIDLRSLSTFKKQTNLIHLNQNDDPYAIFNKLQENEISLHNYKSANRTKVRLITKDNTLLGNFDIIDDTVEDKRILSKAKTVYMFNMLAGVMKFDTISDDEGKNLYVNGIKVSDKVASVKNIINNMKDTKSISSLIGTNEITSLTSQFKYRKDAANNKIYIDIPDTYFQVMARKYETKTKNLVIANKRYMTTNIVVELLKNGRTYKKLHDVLVNEEYGKDLDYPEITGVSVNMDSIQIMIMNKASIIISIA